MNLDQLQKIAEEATPGPWETDGHGLGIYPSLDGKSGPALCALMSKSGAYDNHEANAAHIAAASPDVVLRLIAVARAAKDLTSEIADLEKLAVQRGDALILARVQSLRSRAFALEELERA